MDAKNLLLTSALFIFFGSCDFNRQDKKQYSHQYKIVEPDARLHKLAIEMAAGELDVEVNQAQLMLANCSYPGSNWKPDFTYQMDGGVVRTSLHQALNWKMKDFEGKNLWNLSLDPKVPLELSMKLGAGSGKVDLSGTNIQSLVLSTGAGESTIYLQNTSVPEIDLKTAVGEVLLDMSGQWNNSNRTVISGGLGELTIVVPKDIGVRARISGLLGEIRHPFTQSGNYYTNALYGTTEHSLELIISAGIGQVNIREAD